MNLFILLYFIIYGVMHLYFYGRLATVAPMGRAVKAPVSVILFLLYLSPLLVRISERAGCEGLALAFSYGGYAWMGFLFLFFSVALPMEVWRWFASFWGRESRLCPSPKILFYVSVVCAMLLGAYGCIEACRFRVERIHIKTGKKLAGMDSLRIVQISDVHVGFIVRGQRLAAIVEAIRLEEPHVIVSTGDLVDGQMDDLQEAGRLFTDLKPPLGKFAVAGNHELYAGLDKALRFTEHCGFTILRGGAVSPVPDLYIAGVDDPVIVNAGLGRGEGEKRLRDAIPDGAFSIILKHRPEIEEGSSRRFDLQLSGHTHGGQIFPFSVVTSMLFTHHRGHFLLPSGGRLHVSRGTGTWGPPIRIASPPEITVIDIHP